MDDIKKLYIIIGDITAAFCSLTESESAGVILVSNKGQIKYATPPVQREVGYEAKAFINKDLTFILKYSGNEPVHKFLLENCLNKVCDGELVRGDSSTTLVEIRTSYYSHEVGEQEHLRLALTNPSNERIRLS